MCAETGHTVCYKSTVRYKSAPFGIFFSEILIFWPEAKIRAAPYLFSEEVHFWTSLILYCPIHIVVLYFLGSD